MGSNKIARDVVPSLLAQCYFGGTKNKGTAVYLFGAVEFRVVIDSPSCQDSATIRPAAGRTPLRSAR